MIRRTGKTTRSLKMKAITPAKLTPLPYSRAASGILPIEPMNVKKATAPEVASVKQKKAPAKKKAVQPTATDKILKIIKGSKTGVDAPTLVKKTGFNQKKVRNILFRTYKQGKIKRLDKGIYTGV